MSGHRRFAAGLAAVILGIALLFTLAGCGGGGDAADQPDQPTPGVDCTARPADCT